MENHILYVPIKCADFLLANATRVNQPKINRVGSLEKAGHCRNIWRDYCVKGQMQCLETASYSYILSIKIMARMKSFQSRNIYWIICVIVMWHIFVEIPMNKQRNKLSIAIINETIMSGRSLCICSKRT